MFSNPRKFHYVSIVEILTQRIVYWLISNGFSIDSCSRLVVFIVLSQRRVISLFALPWFDSCSKTSGFLNQLFRKSSFSCRMMFQRRIEHQALSFLLWTASGLCPVTWWFFLVPLVKHTIPISWFNSNYNGVEPIVGTKNQLLDFSSIHPNFCSYRIGAIFSFNSLLIFLRLLREGLLFQIRHGIQVIQQAISPSSFAITNELSIVLSSPSSNLNRCWWRYWVHPKSLNPPPLPYLW